jgi:hypothetical protein
VLAEVEIASSSRSTSASVIGAPYPSHRSLLPEKWANPRISTCERSQFLMFMPSLGTNIRLIEKSTTGAPGLRPVALASSPPAHSAMSSIAQSSSIWLSGR